MGKKVHWGIYFSRVLKYFDVKTVESMVCDECGQDLCIHKSVHFLLRVIFLWAREWCERGAGAKKAHWRVEILTILLPKLAISTISREIGGSVHRLYVYISNAISYVIDPFRSRNWGFCYLNLPLRHCWWMRGRARLHNEHETRTWEKQGWRQVRGNFFPKSQGRL